MEISMTPLIPEQIENYCTNHSTPPSALASELEQYTHKNCEYPQMLTGHWEAALLRVLVGIAHAKRILEIGTFSGYSAINLAENLPDDGEIVTCEIDPKNAEVASRFIARSPHAGKISLRMGSALETIKTVIPSFDLVFLDADKENYLNYFQACLPLVRPGGLIVADNVLWSGRVFKPRADSDRAIVAFNDTVAKDARVECVMLPVRDGVSLIRKR
jgi:caffeoyl-CoA O-methyltransferase